ncbi:MAG: AmmeMemoRadiSam system protein B, partial [Planctomycetota bacterium]|nr:AmmeMemoRadiSam system protein B [Planctomycetota bacterium]
MSGCDRVSDNNIIGEEKNMSVRESVLAGSWYPSNPETLRKEITRYLNNVKLSEEIKSQEVHSLIVPHAGYQYSGQGAAYGYALIKNKPFKRVIIIGPSHRVGFRGVSVSKATHYETPLGRVPLDQEACSQLLKKGGGDKLFSYQKVADANEHSLEIQLPFLQSVLSSYQIVPLIAGEIDNYEDTAKAIREIIDSNTLVIISSDFTHYGDGPPFYYAPFKDNIKENLNKLDNGAITEIVNISPTGFLEYVKNTGITVCGYKPILILLHLLEGEGKNEILNSRGVLLNYYTSGEMTGDYLQSVSYATILFSKKGMGMKSKTDDLLNEAEQKMLLSLARETLRLYLKEKNTPKVKENELTEKLREKRGVFVT